MFISGTMTSSPSSLYLRLLPIPHRRIHSSPTKQHPNSADVLKGIASSQKWDFDRLNFSKLQVSKVRFGTGRRFDFHFRFGKSYFLFKFPDEVAPWNKFKKGGADFEDFIREVSSKAGLDSFKVEDPFELPVAGQYQASLLLPVASWNEILATSSIGCSVFST